jgi:hypothetical protein
MNKSLDAELDFGGECCVCVLLNSDYSYGVNHSRSHFVIRIKIFFLFFYFYNIKGNTRAVRERKKEDYRERCVQYSL